jgi:hypothetical protein
MIGVMVLINLLGVRVFGEVEVRTGSNDMSGSSSAADIRRASSCLSSGSRSSRFSLSPASFSSASSSTSEEAPTRTASASATGRVRHASAVGGRCAR